ncbi:MAG: LysR family transcriptional regulator [Veillonellales bacterium]
MYNVDWLILKTISEEKNITKAAERLYITQPAVTRRLKNMENEFKANLVLRTPGGILLTPQGEELLAYAKKTLLEFKQVKERIQSMENKVQGSLFLGVSSDLSHYELPEILKNFLEIYPDAEVSLKTGRSQKVLRMLQKDEISLAILNGDHHWDGEKCLLREDPICLVSSKPITLKDLPHSPRIVASSSMQSQIDEWWHQTFYCSPVATMEVDSIDSCRQMVLHGLGWAILPSIGLKQYDKVFSKNLYWEDGTPLVRRTWLMYRSSYLQLPIVCAFAEHVKKHFQAAV